MTLKDAARLSQSRGSILNVKGGQRGFTATELVLVIGILMVGFAMFRLEAVRDGPVHQTSAAQASDDNTQKIETSTVQNFVTAYE